jgi:tetratricopeptide (TPR) repeat protein
MKVSRYMLLALSLVAIMAVAVAGSGCAFAKKVIAKDKLNQGVLAYNRGNTSEAAVFFKDTVELIPDNPTAWLYYGAALRKQYLAVTGDERERRAKEAMDAYLKALEAAQGDCKLKDNAMGYIATIYDELGEPDKHREWLLKRAEDPCADDKTKATTYYSIAHGYWTCAYNQSTRYADKFKMSVDPFHTRNFYFEPDRLKFEDCLAKGLEYIEKALAVNPNYADALSYHSLLYREKQKSTKSEADRKKFADEAEKIAKRAIELTKQQKEQAQQAPQG